MNDSGPATEALDVQTSQEAVLTVMRLFRALEQVDTGLTPQQYRILKLAGPAVSVLPGWPSGWPSPPHADRHRRRPGGCGLCRA